MRFICLALLIVTSGHVTNAVAQELTEESIIRLVNSMPEVLRPLRSTKFDRTEFEYPSGQPYAPLFNTVRYFKQYDEETYSQMTNAAEKFGFVTLEEWARIGDRVSVTEIALKREARGEEIPDIPSDTVIQFGSFPEASRIYTLLIRGLQNVTESDKEIVAPLLDLLNNSN